MSGSFNKICNQEYSNFQRGSQQCHQSYPVDYQKQNPYPQTDYKRISPSDQTFRYEPLRGTYAEQMHHQMPKLPSGSCPMSNVSSLCDRKPQMFGKQDICSQQRQLMPDITTSALQTPTVSSFSNSATKHQNLSTQVPPFYPSSSLPQPFYSSGITRMGSPVSNIPKQCQQNQAPDKMPQFLASNILPTNSQYQTNQAPPSFSTHQANASSHFSNSSSQQGNYQVQTQPNCKFNTMSCQINSASQQSTVLPNVPLSSNLHSTIPNQNVNQQQFQARPNQTPQFPNQMLPNISYQSDNRPVPFSQNSISSFSVTQNHRGNTGFQFHQPLATNQPNRPPNQQQIQHNQPNVFSIKSGSLQPLNNIPESAKVCNQQSYVSSGFNKNQTMQIPTNSLPSNIQNCSYQAQVVPPSSQVSIPASAPGAQPNLNTGMPSFGPPNVCNSFTKPAQHFGNYQIQGNVPEVRKSQSELLPNRPENANLQPIQYHHLKASNTQTDGSQHLGSIPPISTSMASLGNHHSLCQQSSHLSECTNQVTPIPGNNLPLNSQTSLFQKGTSSSQIPIALSASASQPNPNVTGLLPLGQSSNISFPPIPRQQYFGNYHMLGNVSETGIDIGGKSQDVIDSEWVSQWLSVRGKGKTSLGSIKPVVAIPEIRKLLQQASTFLKALSLIRDSLMSCKNEDEEIWENKTKQAMNIKLRLEGLMQKLLQPEVVLQLLKKLRRMKKKRELHRRQREKRKMEKLEQQKRRLELRRSLDSYMEAEKEKVLRAKREEELIKEADNILSEVRRKLQEGKRAQERLRVIEKLRQARKETAEKRGLHISEETDKQFSDKITLLKEMVQRQLTHYDAEEKALKVMLETEQEGQLEQEETYRKERQRKLLDKMQEEMKQCLFGDNDSLDASDPLWYFRQYYTQAHSSLEALIQTRRQWDMYLVPPTNASGSSIPACWITPDPPSSDSWASALFLKECE